MPGGPESDGFGRYSHGAWRAGFADEGLRHGPGLASGAWRQALVFGRSYHHGNDIGRPGCSRDRRRLAGVVMNQRLDHFMAGANAAYYATQDPFADFTTAPEISQVFGELLGLWAAVTWRLLGAPPAVSLVEA